MERRAPDGKLLSLAVTDWEPGSQLELPKRIEHTDEIGLVHSTVYTYWSKYNLPRCIVEYGSDGKALLTFCKAYDIDPSTYPLSALANLTNEAIFLADALYLLNIIILSLAACIMSMTGKWCNA